MWTIIFCAILLVALAGADNTTAVNASSGKSELNVALINIGPVGGYGWAYEGHVGASKMAQKLPNVKLPEIANVDASNAP